MFFHTKRKDNQTKQFGINSQSSVNINSTQTTKLQIWEPFVKIIMIMR